MNEPALIARAVLDVGGSILGRHELVPIADRRFGRFPCCPHGIRLAMTCVRSGVTLPPDRPVPAILPGQPLNDQVKTVAVAPGDDGRRENAISSAPPWTHAGRASLWLGRNDAYQGDGGGA